MVLRERTEKAKFNKETGFKNHVLGGDTYTTIRPSCGHGRLVLAKLDSIHLLNKYYWGSPVPGDTAMDETEMISAFMGGIFELKESQETKYIF